MGVISDELTKGWPRVIRPSSCCSCVLTTWGLMLRVGAVTQTEEINDACAVMLLEVMHSLRGSDASGTTLADCKRVSVNLMAHISVVRIPKKWWSQIYKSCECMHAAHQVCPPQDLKRMRDGGRPESDEQPLIGVWRIYAVGRWVRAQSSPSMALDGRQRSLPSQAKPNQARPSWAAKMNSAFGLLISGCVSERVNKLNKTTTHSERVEIIN